MMIMSEEKLPGWDLGDLYKGIDDPRIDADLEKYRRFCRSFAGKYKGKLSGLDGAELARALKSYEKNSLIGSRVGGFAYLNMVTQMKNAEAMAFYQNVSEKLTDYSKPLIFLSLEINRLPAAKIAGWLKNPQAAFYKPWLERVRRFKKY